MDIVNEKSNFKTDLIPVDAIENEATFAKFPGMKTKDQWTTNAPEDTCMDYVGNSICSIYEFTIKNPNPTTAQTVIGKLNTLTNGSGTKKFTHMYYAVFRGAAASIAGSSAGFNISGEASDTVTVSGTAQTPAAVGTMVVAPTAFDETEDVWNHTIERLEANGGSVTYSVLIWLEEADTAQNDEQGLTLTAGITFTSDVGGDTGGVTGVLVAGN